MRLNRETLSLWLKLKTAPLATMVVNVPRPQKWVFIVGCYNSGTTLLHRLLAEHELVGSMPNEGQFFTRLLPRGADIGLPRLWAMRPDYFHWTEDSQASIDADRIKRDWAWFYNHPQRPVLLEKTILNSARTRWLQQRFENSHFIGLYRNGYAVAEGIHRKEGHDIRIAAKQWAVSNEILLNDATHLCHYHSLRYEDLVADPRSAMQGVCRFLELSELSDAVFQKEFTVHKFSSGIRNMNDDSFARLSAEQRAIVNEEAGDVLRRLDYPVLT